jgi:hypothetical protein
LGDELGAITGCAANGGSLTASTSKKSKLNTLFCVLIRMMKVTLLAVLLLAPFLAFCDWHGEERAGRREARLARMEAIREGRWARTDARRAMREAEREIRQSAREAGREARQAAREARRAARETWARNWDF